jgi:hypothetical protein
MPKTISTSIGKELKAAGARKAAVRIKPDSGATITRIGVYPRGRWMKITTATIAEANRRMAEIAADESLGDGDIRMSKMANVWWPIMNATDRPEIPRGMSEEFVGYTDDGQQIVWGQKRPIPGTEMKWRELALSGPQRSPLAPTIDWCDAAAEAARRANAGLAAGNMASCATWKRIAAAIETLQAEKPAPGRECSSDRPTL